jgi:hypothetical protein
MNEGVGGFILGALAAVVLSLAIGTVVNVNTACDRDEHWRKICVARGHAKLVVAADGNVRFTWNEP